MFCICLLNFAEIDYVSDCHCKEKNKSHVHNLICFIFQELKLKDEECAKLLKVRDQIGEELEELTASLFEVIQHSARSLFVHWFVYDKRP